MENYLKLRNIVDEKFSGIESKYPLNFKCKNGCSGCCVDGLSVNVVEFMAIKNELVTYHQPFTHKKTEGKCPFLNESEACTIYSVRPIICRSHGAPTKLANHKSVCPLNFSEVALDELEKNDFFDLETLNTILATININYAKKMKFNADERFSLSPTIFFNN